MNLVFGWKKLQIHSKRMVKNLKYKPSWRLTKRKTVGEQISSTSCMKYHKPRNQVVKTYQLHRFNKQMMKTLKHQPNI